MRLGGFGFAVLDTVTKRANVPALCFLVGPDCTFNQLVDCLGNAADPTHPASGMLLGITGLLLFTPRRVELGISSAPVFEDKLVIIRRMVSGNSESVSRGIRGAWRAATGPFATDAWTLCLSALAVVCYVISLFSLFLPTSFLKSKMFARRKKMGLWLRNFLHNALGGVKDLDRSVERNFEPTSRMLRMSFLATVALTFVYYEAALIVGSPAPTFSRPVRGLSDRKLCTWAVLKDSALEESFAAVAEVAGVENLHKDEKNEIRTWALCDKFDECFDMVDGNDRSNIESCDRYGASVENVIAFESVALHQFRREPQDCSVLGLVQTKEPLFEFNGGWMYSRPANGTVHKSILAIDVEIRKARRDGTSERLLTEAVGSKIECPDRGEQVFAKLMLFPILLALILPLLFALILVFLYLLGKTSR